jgi:hypothetical protein
MEQHDEIHPCTLQNTQIRLLKLETGFSLPKKKKKHSEKKKKKEVSLEVGIHEI